MILTTDISLSFPLWERADNELCSKESVDIFTRLIDIYIIALSIGIKADKTITEYEPLAQAKTIGRNTYQSQINTDLRNVLDFMFQNAIINSKTVKFSEDERLQIAFDPDYKVEKFSVADFLTGFANYGIKEIFDHLSSYAPFVATSEMNDYLSGLADEDYDELIREITLDSI